MGSQNLKPSRWYYGLGILVLLMGAILSAFFFFEGLSNLKYTITRVIVPGKSDVRLADPGRYTVYYEYRTVLEGKVHSTGKSLPGGLQCSLIHKATGTEISLSPCSMPSTQSSGARESVSVWNFSIDKAGDYEFSAWYPEGQEGPRIVLRVNYGFLSLIRKFIREILWSSVILFGAVCACVIILVVTSSRRGKAEKELEATSKEVVKPMVQDEKQMRTWGMLCHLTALAGFIGVPLGNILGPLVVWLIKRNDFHFAEEQGKESLNFQISMTIYSIIAILLALVLIGIPLLIGLWIANLILVIVASVKASNGESYCYPCTIRFIK